MRPAERHAYRRRVTGARPDARSWQAGGRSRPVLRRSQRIRSSRLVPVASLVGLLTTLSLLALVSPATSERKQLSRPSLRFCADPGHCGGEMKVSVAREEVTATSFTRTWAREWNKWAAAHQVPRQIVTAGCNFLWTERYYLCAVRELSDASASSAASCGLVVVEPETRPNPSDQIESGLETACRVLAAYPEQTVE